MADLFIIISAIVLAFVISREIVDSQIEDASNRKIDALSEYLNQFPEWRTLPAVKGDPE